MYILYIDNVFYLRYKEALKYFGIESGFRNFFRKIYLFSRNHGCGAPMLCLRIFASQESATKSMSPGVQSVIVMVRHSWFQQIWIHTVASTIMDPLWHQFSESNLSMSYQWGTQMDACFSPSSQEPLQVHNSNPAGIWHFSAGFAQCPCVSVHAKFRDPCVSVHAKFLQNPCLQIHVSVCI